MDDTYLTKGGVKVLRHRRAAVYADGIRAICDRLNTQRGVILSSGFEFPGRYTAFDWAFADPPIQVEARDKGFAITALNARGAVLLSAIEVHLAKAPNIEIEARDEAVVKGAVTGEATGFDESRRSQQPTIFTMLRQLSELFRSDEDSALGLYGAFSYDLGFQFEPIELKRERPSDHRDIVLFLPDEILMIDHMTEMAHLISYDFEVNGRSSVGLPRETPPAPLAPPSRDVESGSDHGPGEYAASVEKAREKFKCGDLFEAVLSQTFTQQYDASASALFDRLRASNPAPYGAFMNLGRDEALVAASPEMFVRVEGRRVETCPISGTIQRGRDPLEDAERIRTLLNSEKDLSELTMCTDVDRNDKSRICVPGTVKVIGRRQLEMYSKLIHTVDHVEGTLAEGYDALDAFLTHMWAVTVTGAPKPWAMQFIEDTEKSVRRWYGGAIGRMTFDGDMNTGLTLRTIRLSKGVAEVRAGATLLFDSDPQAEDDECRLKASALFAVIKGEAGVAPIDAEKPDLLDKSVLIVDHKDSFVHTIGAYLRQLGCDVRVVRSDAARRELEAGARPDLLFLSPGPGRPSDFETASTLALADKAEIPVFGVCLGLQAMIEYEGGDLSILDYPMHGKPSAVVNHGGAILDGFAETFEVGRYHSLHARIDTAPPCFDVTAATPDGVVMAIEHKTKPWAAVQFHPESILTSPYVVGLPLLRRAVGVLCK